MAASLSACGVRIVRQDFVDPVRAKDTRSHGPRERVADAIPAHLRAVNAAALELYRIDTVRGLVLRQEYCGYGSQSMKAERVSLALGDGRPMGLRVYRESLERARGWIAGRLGS